MDVMSPHSLDDEEIVRDILAGNVNRYAEIVRKYQENVANLCYKLAGQNIDIEEVSQHVFVELYTALPRFKFQSKLSTFIYRITLNTVCKELKHNKRIVTGTIDNNILDNHDNSSAEHRIIMDERHRQLHQAIGCLKQEQRTAIILYTFDQFSYNEIAQVMQCSTAKVESLIFRARKNLKNLLITKYHITQ